MASKIKHRLCCRLSSFWHSFLRMRTGKSGTHLHQLNTQLIAFTFFNLSIRAALTPVFSRPRLSNSCFKSTTRKAANLFAPTLSGVEDILKSDGEKEVGLVFKTDGAIRIAQLRIRRALIRKANRTLQ